MARKRFAGSQLTLFAGQMPVRNRPDKTDSFLQCSPLSATTPVGDNPATVSVVWLCISFPELVFEALRLDTDSPTVIVAGQGSNAKVAAANTVATDAGILTEMSLGTALAVVPKLIVHQREISAEAAMLQRLAKWALKYTPIVSIDVDGALLLEVRASLKLFGGLGQLREQLSMGLMQQGYRSAVIATAPTPRAALWLARANISLDCHAIHDLPARLADIPLNCLRWPSKVQLKLLQTGVTTLGECLRLPRDGFARRIGPDYLRELDQGLGIRSELLHYYQEADIFQDNFEFTQDTLCSIEIEKASRVLLTNLSFFMRQRQVAVQQIKLFLEHCRKPPTVLDISLRTASCHTSYLHELLRLRLERQALPAPVTAIVLQAAAMAPAAPAKADLFDASAGTENAVVELIERLRARLGSRSVYGIRQVADYRPEYAWRVENFSGLANTNDVPGEMISRDRPIWLLGTPEQLDSCKGRPVDYKRRTLAFVSDAERIETGWWDGNDVRRDYYTVECSRGSRWWIFQDCHDSSWYLHGIYG